MSNLKKWTDSYYTNVLKLASLFSCQGRRSLPSVRPAGRWGQVPDPFKHNTKWVYVSCTRQEEEWERKKRCYCTFHYAPRPIRSVYALSTWLRDSQTKLLRKEVIQAHVLVHLPCYDFTLLTDHTFNTPLLTVGVCVFGYSQLGWCDGRCVQYPGTYSTQYS